MIALVLGIVLIAVLLWACSNDHIIRAEREERRFRRWKLKQDRENGEAYPPGDE